MGESRGMSKVNVVFGWLRKRSMKVKILLGIAFAFFTLVVLKLTVKDHSKFHLASEIAHASGVLLLIYKLIRKKTCSGLSLKMQEITAIFLVMRVICNFTIDIDIYLAMDVFTLFATLWVVYMIRFKLKHTYMTKADHMPLYFLVVPSAIVAFLIHPSINNKITGILWAFCVYLESVSVLPQLRMIQKANSIEPFTAHYVFALGVARFLSCANWMIHIYDTGGKYLFFFGFGYLWMYMYFIAEIVQTFILADFCYYYVKSVMDGQLIIRMPV